MAAQPDWTPMPNGVVNPPSLWKALLLRGKTTKNGEPGPILAHLANAITALRHAPEWDGVLAFNEFSLATVALRSPPWEGTAVGAEWTDHEDRLTANWLQHAGVCVSTNVAGEAVQCVAMDRRFHPVRDYLNSLTWDGQPRIDKWLTTYAGVPSSPYADAVGARWVISAVARIFQPGTKADCALILEGEQGDKKSTLLKLLTDPWFTDEIAEIGSKDSSMQTAGVWLIELGELDSISRVDVSRIKAFMSRSTDRFRPPYGRRTISAPRQCIFAGSTNKDDYLRDETGARRFWPVACTSALQLDDIARDRDQLWAETVVRYRAGEKWWLEEAELIRAAKKQQMERYEGDTWDELISEWLEQPSAKNDEGGHPLTPPLTSDSSAVSIQDVLTHCIGKRKDQWTQFDKIRVARVLVSMGWKRKYDGARGSREWRYHRL